MPDQDQAASPETRAKRLRHIRETILKLTRENLSKKSGIPLNTLQNWEQGRHSGLVEKGAKKIIQTLTQEGIKCSLEWLLYGIGKPPISPSTEEIFLTEEEIIAEELQLFHHLNPHAIDTLIQDDSMLPCFWAGDYVAGKSYTGKDIKKTLGLPCIVETESGNRYVRVLEESDEPGKYNLFCANPNALAKNPLENIALICAAPIMWLRRKNLKR